MLPIEVHSVRANSALPPHRPTVDTRIKLQKIEQGRLKKVSWDPIHNKFREGLHDFKIFDWVKNGNSPGEVRVLFLKKPTGGHGLFVDNQALDAVTDR